MKNLMIFFIITLFSLVISKSGVSSLTESLGHEVIEIGPRIKELPPGLEEEPSGENNEEDVQSSTATPEPTTKQDTKKTTTTAATTSKTSKNDRVVQEEDEARIEKELADMYKDHSDYKSDSNEITTYNMSTPDDEEKKPVARQRTSFKFQPDVHNKAEVERFRTSVDDISCEKRSTEKLLAENPLSQSASKCFIDVILGLIPLILLQ